MEQTRERTKQEQADRKAELTDILYYFIHDDHSHVYRAEGRPGQRILKETEK
jgi:hypothetical protein